MGTPSLSKKSIQGRQYLEAIECAARVVDAERLHYRALIDEALNEGAIPKQFPQGDAADLLRSKIERLLKKDGIPRVEGQILIMKSKMYAFVNDHLRQEYGVS